MALQKNGVSVGRVLHERQLIEFLIGPGILTLHWDGQNFMVHSRWWLDGRLSTRTPPVSNTEWKAALSQAHGIAEEHGWKEKTE